MYKIYTSIILGKATKANAQSLRVMEPEQKKVEEEGIINDQVKFKVKTKNHMMDLKAANIFYATWRRRSKGSRKSQNMNAHYKIHPSYI